MQMSGKPKAKPKHKTQNSSASQVGFSSYFKNKLSKLFTSYTSSFVFNIFNDKLSGFLKLIVLIADIGNDINFGYCLNFIMENNMKNDTISQNNIIQLINRCSLSPQLDCTYLFVGTPEILDTISTFHSIYLQREGKR